MGGGDGSFSSPFVSTGKRCSDGVRSLIRGPKCNNPFSIPSISSSSINPASSSSLWAPRVSFSSSSQAPRPPPPPKIHDFPPRVNPPETEIPDPATLREQWKFATRLFGRWYAHAWGTAILACASFYALGRMVKREKRLLEEEKREGRGEVRDGQ